MRFKEIAPFVRLFSRSEDLERVDEGSIVQCVEAFGIVRNIRLFIHKITSALIRSRQTLYSIVQSEIGV